MAHKWLRFTNRQKAQSAVALISDKLPGDLVWADVYEMADGKYGFPIPKDKVLALLNMTAQDIENIRLAGGGALEDFGNTDWFIEEPAIDTPTPSKVIPPKPEPIDYGND